MKKITKTNKKVKINQEMDEVAYALAKLKSEEKDIKQEISELTEELLGLNPPKKISTDFGVLNLRTREKYDIPDNWKIIDTIGDENFVELASISKTKVQKIVGEVGIEKLLSEKTIIRKDDTKYFQLK